MMGGGGASGKTFFIEQGLVKVPTKESKKAVHINADDIKLMLPEYDKLRFHPDPDTAKTAAGYVHQESSILANEITRRALKEGYTVVLDGTGSNPKKVKKQLALARRRGYDTQGHYVNTPFETALNNNQKRFDNPKEKRWVGPDILQEAHQSVSANFEKLAPLFNTMELLHNDGKSLPKVIATSSRKSKIEVGDKDLYDAFLRKGDELK
jgi:predicted kinase